VNGAVTKNLCAGGDALTTPASVNTLLTNMRNYVKEFTSPYVRNLICGYNNNITYILRNCKVIENFCSNCNCEGKGWVVLIRHDAIFGDNKRHYFDAAGTIDISGTEFGVDASAYETTLRPWYLNSAKEWSDNYFTFSTGMLGATYRKAITNGLVAADRIQREPCGACLSNSELVPVVSTIASSNLYDHMAAATAAEIAEAIQHIHDRIVELDTTHIVNTYFAFDNGDFYLLKNCEKDVNAATIPSCAGVKYVGMARNSGLGNLNRWYFPVNAQGVVLSTGAVDGGVFYNTTARPWFQWKDGWTDQYISTTNVTYRTFTHSFVGGVVAADPSVMEDIPCMRTKVCPVPTCPACEPANALPKDSLPMALLVALFGVIFVIFRY
jgi:hypothetical protein